MSINDLQKFLIELDLDDAYNAITDCKIYHSSIRVIHDSDAISLEHIQYRLNLVVDANNKVVDVYYG